MYLSQIRDEKRYNLSIQYKKNMKNSFSLVSKGTQTKRFSFNVQRVKT